MSRSPGVLRWLGRAILMPFTRPVRDVRTSARNVHDAVEKLRSVKAQRAHAARVLDQATAGLDGRQRFERMVEAGGWTERALAEQLAAVRRARLSALSVGAVVFAVLLWLMAQMTGWPVLLLGMIAIIGLLSALVQALRHAWWEFELQERTLLPMSEFIGRPDLFARVFKVARQ